VYKLFIVALLHGRSLGDLTLKAPVLLLVVRPSVEDWKLIVESEVVQSVTEQGETYDELTLQA
jgi:hypothetical protein